MYQSGQRQGEDFSFPVPVSVEPSSGVNCSATSKAMVFIPSIGVMLRVPWSMKIPFRLANSAATCLVWSYVPVTLITCVP